MLRTLLAPLLLCFSSHLSAEEIPLEHCDNLLDGQVQVSGTTFLVPADREAMSFARKKPASGVLHAKLSPRYLPN
jgi:hypothetical protein